jgi:hypothetical protein
MPRPLAKICTLYIGRIVIVGAAAGEAERDADCRREVRARFHAPIDVRGFDAAGRGVLGLRDAHRENDHVQQHSCDLQSRTSRRRAV